MATETSKLNAEEKKQVLEFALPVGTILTSKQRTYKVKGVLGAGGFGITYRVSSILQEGNIEFEHDFAIKEHFMKGCYRNSNKIDVICAPTLKSDFEQGREDFIEEAKRLHKLSRLSANIVRVNENFVANGTAYYVMEYLDGGDLINYIKRNGPLSEGRALSVFVPIAKAVEQLHEAHLLHLDIKPDNIVLKRDVANNSFTPVLIDFGISKHFDRSGRPTSNLVAKGASDGYAPQEQYAEIRTFAPEIDVYALGATLFYLLTGQNPPKAFDISSVEELIGVLPQDVSSRTKNAIATAMQKSKFDRTPSVGKLLSDVEECYTLPLGYVLKSHGRKFRIVEIITENNYSLTYKAIETFSSDEHQRSELGGIATEVPRHFVIVEYFCKARDKRLADGITSSNAGSWDSREHGLFMESIANMSKESPYQVCEYYGEEYGLSWQFVKANGTDYYIYEVVPQPPFLKRLAEKATLFLKHYSKYIGLMVIAASLVFGIRYCQLPKPTEAGSDTTPDKDTTAVQIEVLNEDTIPQSPAQIIHDKRDITTTQEEQEETADVQNQGQEVTPSDKIHEEDVTQVKILTDDETYQRAINNSDWTTIERLAKKGYKKAYYQLANHYFKLKEYKVARDWAEKAIVAKEDKTAASALIKKIDTINRAEDAYEKAEKYVEAEQWDKALYYAQLAQSLRSAHSTRLGEIIEMCKMWDPPVWNP